MSSADKDREVWRRYWTFWYEQRQQEADAAKRLAEEYGETFPASSSAAIARILQQRRPMRGLRSDEVVEAVPVWAFEDTPEQAPVPESGPINAAGQEVETGGVSSHGPGPQAVTDEESTVPAPAAPSTPQPEAPTPRTDAALEKPTFEAYGRLADLARQLERELAEKDARLAGIIFSGSLDEVKCGDLQRWRNEFKAKQSASSARALTTDDWMLARKCVEGKTGVDFIEGFADFYKAFARSSTTAPLATSDPEGHRQAIADAEHDRIKDCAAPNLCLLVGKCQRSATAPSGSDNSPRSDK